MLLQPWSHVHSAPLTAPSTPLLPLTPIKVALSANYPPVARFRIRARVISTIPCTMEQDDSRAVQEEQKEGHPDAEASPADSSVAPSLRFEQICKFQCTACHRWSECSASAAVSDACSVCARQDGLRYGYFLRLIVQDATGMMPLLLSGKEAVSQGVA
jgi:hypothetical protein